MAIKRRIRRIRISRLIGLLLLLAILPISLINFFPFFKDSITGATTNGYLASSTHTVEFYDNDFNKVQDVVRGLRIKFYNQKIKQQIDDEEVLYRRIIYENKQYLVKNDNVVDKFIDIVQEKKMYVRTGLTLYKEVLESNIAGYIKKGNELEIIGFDKINSDGSINMYEIKANNLKGYVYAKYVVPTKEDALKNYDEDGLYQIHASRTDTLGGGSAADLDYYPYEKPNFEDNPLLTDAKMLYINANVINNIDSYINIAKKTEINGLVVDIKENTIPSYPSKIMNEYSPTSFSKAANTWDAYKLAIKKIKDAGLYVVGRITVFKDSYYINDHPEDAITSTANNMPYLHNGSYWPSVYVRDVWEYNVKLATEAVVEFGFNEIQFDYMRFPDRINTIENQGLVDMKNKYNETKAQALQAFLMYACDEIHKMKAYVSGDVFGETANSYVSAYGQYWPSLSNILDVISAMPYPDHFDRGQYNLETPWTEPYKLMKMWSASATARQKEIENPAIARTWIQAYNAIKEPHNIYGPVELRSQIEGLKDGGLLGGYITWNSGSNLAKYESLSTGF